jgi:hypothetical protein
MTAGAEAGDLANGALISLAVVALVALGFAVGRWRVLGVLAGVVVLALVGSDALYFGLGVNLAGYCGEPRCDPGPLPLSLGLLFLPAVLALAALGVALRRRRA